MIILHADSIGGRLFVWGETPGAEGVQPEALEAALRAAGVGPPTCEMLPRRSSPAVPLETPEAVEFLAAGAGRGVAARLASIGPDLAAWTAALQFCASLVARQRVVRGYALENNRFKASGNRSMRVP